MFQIYLNKKISTLQAKLMNIGYLGALSKYVLASITFIVVVGCAEDRQESKNLTYIYSKRELPKKVDSSLFIEKYNLPVPTVPDTIPYLETIARIRQLRTKLKKELSKEKISIENVKTVFTNDLVNTIIPYWYGTRWSFEGHTAVPGKGEVACGYFVSTTLRDMGLKLNRYKLAQKSPIDEAKVISCGSEICIVEDVNHQLAISEIDKNTSEGLYFIGYDSGHVGYLLKEKGELFLIHSNYMSPFSVSVERLGDSMVFRSFNKFYLVDVTHNEALMKKWLNNSVIL